MALSWGAPILKRGSCPALLKTRSANHLHSFTVVRIWTPPSLIMPLVFFMAPTDPRMLSTIDAILESPVTGGLVSDSLVHRYPPQPRIDGLPGEEGTFNMCSFWLVEALTRASLAYPERLD